MRQLQNLFTDARKGEATVLVKGAEVLWYV